MLVPICNPSKTSEDDFTEEEALILDKMHKERIKLSDAIYESKELIKNSTNRKIGQVQKKEIEMLKESLIFIVRCQYCCWLSRQFKRSY